MQAAIGCAQLQKLPGFVAKRRENFEYFKGQLLDLEEKLILPEPCVNARPSWFGFLITCREGIDKNLLVEYLEEHGVQTRMLFAGNLLKQPCFDGMRERQEGYRVVDSLCVTDLIMERSFWVGVYPGMTLEMLDYMARMIREAVWRFGK